VKKKALMIACVLLLLIATWGVVDRRSRSAGGASDNAAGDRSAAPAGRRGSGSGALAMRGSSDPAAGSVDDAIAPGKRARVDSVQGAGSVTGRVVNWSTGEGVASAELTFTSERGAVTVMSRESGAFELTAPSEATRLALATIAKPGFLPYAPELSHSPIRVEVVPERRVSGLVVFLFPALDYEGRVVELREGASQPTPVPGARVRLLGTPAGEQAIDKLETEWVANAKGEFTFHAADYAVFEAIAGDRRGWARLDDQTMLTRKLEIVVGRATARDHKLVGRVVDGKNQPIADALVRADPHGTASTPRATAFAVSAPDGRFELEHLDADRYAVTAHADGFARALVVPVGSDSGPLTLRLDGGQLISGRVVDGDGDAVPIYTLLAMRREGAAREVVTAMSIVDARGRFELRVPPGSYELQASSSGLAPTEAVAVETGARDVVLTMRAGAVLRGVVVDRKTGDKLAYARVMREARNGGATAQPANAGTVTDRNGAFELTGIPAGPLAVTVVAGGYHPKIEAGMTAFDGARLGPITVDLAALAAGEQPTLELVGIGAQLSPDGDALRVDRVIEGGGAHAAGIVAGEHIVAVDGAAVAELGLEGAIGRIRGAENTTIALTIRRAGKLVVVVVTRKKLRA
jgi:hypothetical protein